MGLRFVKGLGERERRKLQAAAGPYRDLADFAKRTGLGKRPLLALAEAGAFEGLGLDRRRALWAVRGLLSVDRRGLDLAPPTEAAELPRFEPLEPAEQVGWDYRSSLHSARGHPMARLRPTLRARRIPDAQELTGLPDGRRVRYVGMVICRQKPQTDSGVTFMTLEDESGFVNLVVWRPVYERCEAVAKTAALLQIDGRVQSEQGVVHLVAEHLSEPSLPPRARRASPAPRSRDFR